MLWHIRLPRLLLAFFVGASLSLAGASFQALLRNPLADPHLLGVSAGGALGVVVGSGFLLSGGFLFLIPVFGLIGSLITVFFVYQLSLRKGALSLYTVILIGVMLNSLFTSIIILLQSMIRSDELTSVLSWLLGNLSFATSKHVVLMAVSCAVSVVFLLTKAKTLNLISLGETTAQSLGVSIEKTKKSIFLAAAFLTGVAVSVSGMIGFVGLLTPHVTRLFFGSDYRRMFFFSPWIGGIVLVISDILARTVLRPQEIPVGVITAFLGAPFFIYLLKQREGKRVI